MKFLTLIFFLFSFSANAEITINDQPKAVKKNIKNANLIGSATLRFLGLKVYDIATWGEDKNFSYDKKFAIQINYDMNFSREELTKRSIEEIENLHDLSKEEEKKYTEKLNEIFVNIKPHDQKIAFFDPKKGVILFYNGKETGRITDLKFARLFVDIWLDEKGSYPKVSAKLIGK